MKYAILQLLKTKQGPIKALEINKQLKLEIEEKTFYPIRKAVLELTKEGFLIASNSRGFYLIKDKDELDKYIDSLKNRIRAMRKRIRVLKKSYNQKPKRITRRR